MRHLVLIIALLAASLPSRAAEYDEPIDGGRSPDGKMVVVNIHNGEGGYWVIRDLSGSTLFSAQSVQNEYINDFASAAWTVLWRPDSQFVAVAFSTTKFSVETLVLRRTGNTIERVNLPAIDPFDWEHAAYGSSDNTHRVPYEWRKSGDLVMDITTGYHTKSEPGTTGYFLTIHFVGQPPRATKGSRTKVTTRD